MNVEAVVKSRYSVAAQAREASLCCPVDYNRKYLEIIPREVIDKDYGCGDPSQHVREGETVLDLGSGAGKICFIAAQVVGPKGRVIGVDMNDDMLDMARRHQKTVGDALGYHNVEFRKGRIQDLALDLAKLEEDLREQPIQCAESFLAAEARAEDLRVSHPLVRDESIDVVVSNCVLNLVDHVSREKLFREILRVLKRGGRAVISDIVSDEEVPLAMQNDPKLWSGCISGALTEEGFLQAFEDAGFYGIRLVKWNDAPWQTVNGIEFRSITVEAYKGTQEPRFEHRHAVIYKGPFKAVLDDEGHRLARGVRHAVSDQIFQQLKKEPYRDHFIFVDPREPVAPGTAEVFDSARATRRHPRETKGLEFKATSDPSQCCDGTGCC